MYTTLLFLHSLLRWLVLLFLILAIGRGFAGWWGKQVFSARDNTLRHITATFAHVQLAIGITLYVLSPITKYFLSNFGDTPTDSGNFFFGLVHSILMFVAVILITIGSSIAKRKKIDRDKFRIMAIFFLLGLIIIFLAIPWPFSPWINRPYFRPF